MFAFVFIARAIEPTKVRSQNTPGKALLAKMQIQKFFECLCETSKPAYALRRQQ